MVQFSDLKVEPLLPAREKLVREFSQLPWPDVNIFEKSCPIVLPPMSRFRRGYQVAAK
jgi:hypothetical protein